MPFKKLKLNKQVLTALLDAGFEEPKEIQKKCVSRIQGGGDLYAIGPEGCGKSTTIIVSILKNLIYAFEDAPRAVVVVNDKQEVLDMLEQFKTLGKNSDIRVVGVYDEGILQDQKEAIYIGCDVVIGTPKRLAQLYFDAGINLNKIQLYLIDNASSILRKGSFPQIIRLSQSLPKCKKVIFTDELNDRLRKAADKFMHFPDTVKVDK